MKRRLEEAELIAMKCAGQSPKNSAGVIVTALKQLSMNPRSSALVLFGPEKSNRQICAGS